MGLRLAPITREQHMAFVRAQPSASPMQLPSWGGVKPDWRAESLGWLDGDRLVGAGLVLFRPLPALRRSLAYLPEGPLIDWSAHGLDRWLSPLLDHLRSQGAFAVRMGPPVVIRRWDAETVKAALADPGAKRLSDAKPSAHDPAGKAVAGRLRGMGWRDTAGDGTGGYLPRLSGSGGGFSAGQPRHVFQLPLAGRTLDEVRQGMNQQWRRNIKKAEKAGVKVVQGNHDDLPAFYELYAETAARDGFTARPPAYFQRMWTALTTEDPGRMRLYLAHHEGDLLAAATMLTVGEHVWYSYGASTTRKREVQPSNAIQWRMMSDAHERGAAVYDLRGITDTLDEADDLAGLLRFKVGTGGEAVEYLGEWDYPLNRLLYNAFMLYMSRR
ncbi:peptidoglycan bridge formation glycyltransferase FemA/FemB family protein [Streptomyces sp. TS71-3]|uniref:lipid II:glycine glycyltransferase FemX n=1 Tax=Streptomyces sp. TS71-3 TaxID=2733862 RepID=UPI001B284541|nr:peptidoglycan bridge formation glycyltransferase FemA/FemB family protein [Streptomyces sp. TS71-3]GHJ40217.1 peptidoglycan bridge formation protein FemAB [Streptomyces sp. TS71-3]